ncbi:MAG: hypothetical protein PHV07_03860 [Oscillospiraceae bacterium]|nr:hypothetical protein [Oscillospiraceae bacterium]
MNKQNFKYAASIYGLTVMGFVMCFIIYMSISLIFTGLGTKVIGYTTYELQDSGEYTAISSYEFAEGEANTIPKAAENQRIVSDYSKLSQGSTLSLNVISQLFMAVIFAVLIYYKLGAIGKRDGDDFRYNGKPIDKNRGLKIGLIAVIPSFALYVFLIVCKLTSYNLFGLYKLINVPFRPIIDLICGNAANINEVSLPAILAMLLVVLILPAICAATYRIGFNDEAIINKLMYKKKK